MPVAEASASQLGDAIGEVVPILSRRIEVENTELRGNIDEIGRDFGRGLATRVVAVEDDAHPTSAEALPPLPLPGACARKRNGRKPEGVRTDRVRLALDEEDEAVSLCYALRGRKELTP